MGKTQIPYPSAVESQPALLSSVPLIVNELMAEVVLSQPSVITNVVVEGPNQPGPPHNRDALLFLLPLLIVLSTFLFLILLFLVFVILLRRRRGIRLRDGEGPVDLSREDLIDGEGGLEGVESRWLESVTESERRTYLRAKGTPMLNRVRDIGISVQLNRRAPRLSTPIPTKLTPNGYYPLTIPLHSREGSSRLVVRTRPGSHAFVACSCPDRNHISTRPFLCFLRPVQPSITQTKRSLLLGGQDVRPPSHNKRRSWIGNQAVSFFPAARPQSFLDRLPL